MQRNIHRRAIELGRWLQSGGCLDVLASGTVAINGKGWDSLKNWLEREHRLGYIRARVRR